MEILCLCLINKESDSPFDGATYHAFIEPAWAGNHVAEAVLEMQNSELNYYKIPIFDNYHKAANYASQQCFGQDAYVIEEEE